MLNLNEVHTDCKDRYGIKGYIAPEVAMGKGYWEKIDIWAAGIIFFLLITKHHPFESLMKYKIKEYMQKFAEVDFTSFKLKDILDKVEDANDIIKTLIISMLDHDPDTRVSSVDFGENSIPIKREHQFLYSSHDGSVAEGAKSVYTEEE